MIDTELPIILSSKEPDIKKKGIIKGIKKIRDIFKREEDKGYDNFFGFHVRLDFNQMIAIKTFKFYLKPIEINLDGLLIEKLIHHFKNLYSKIPQVK